MKEQLQNNTSDQFLKTDRGKTKPNTIEVPSISLPKGGGALKGIDEKFQVNAANGTASFSIPLPITPGRNNFSPSLSLSYNSGGGNSPFGLGWSLDYPSIQRKTDKRLPQYKDEEASDVFMFSGGEDLVPYPVDEDVSSPRRYRPRIEGLFARIEKITHPDSTVGTYWRVTTRDNITTIFGRSGNTRIADPANSSHIFKWLPEISYDNKGNWIIYEYKADSNKDTENRALIPNQVHEQNRKNGKALFTNQYLKRVKYGNLRSYLPHQSSELNPFDPPLPENSTHFFELVFDYGDHDEEQPLPVESASRQWNYRTDAFSDYRAGFEIRTNRLCKRVLMFHHFADIPSFGENYLVRSLELRYEPSSINNSGDAEVTYLKSVTQVSYIKNADNNYSKRSLPPMEFTYEHLRWNDEVREVDTESIIHAPVGLTNNYQWVDLYGEGISGILSEQAEGWYYKSNWGDIDEDGHVLFSRAQVVAPKPSFTGLATGVLSLQDLDASGQKQLVVNSPGVQGYFELTEENDWESFEPFPEVTNLDLRDPNTRLIDLNGDGKPELVVTEETVFVWYASKGKQGYESAVFAAKEWNEENGPAIVFADIEQSIFLADMSGDGLTDIVRIRNNEICYWPNLGYGRFGAKVTMGNAPLFDLPDQFNPTYLHLADVSGTGATDVLYLGENRFKAYLNLSGNAWSNVHQIDPFLAIDSNSKLAVVDLLGTGTSCIVWSSDLPHNSHEPMRYINLMDGHKPHVLKGYKNNFGKETSFEYKSSIWFYLKDKMQGTPWITKLPFPVQVVTKVTVTDKWRQSTFATSYSYHHGYYDYPEREFRGFGRVEQTDVENYDLFYAGNTNSPYITQDHTLYQPPIKTVTWFHTGAFISREKILNQFSQEYFAPSSEGFREKVLHEADLAAQNLSTAEWMEALRACKGMTLRQEVYELDVDALHEKRSRQVAVKLYNTAYHSCSIRLLQPKGENEHAVFLVTESEAITYQYELDLTAHLLNPDPRIVHTLNLATDELGNVLDAVSIAYRRIQTFADSSLPADTTSLIDSVQKAAHLSYTHNRFTEDVIDPVHYRLRLPCEVSTYELTGINAQADGLYCTLEQLRNGDNPNSVSPILYHELPTPGAKQKRLVEQVRMLYFHDDLTNPLPFGELNALGLLYETYKLALTEELLMAVFEDKLTVDIRANLNDNQASGYLLGEELSNRFPDEPTHGQYWIRSGIAGFEDAGEAAAHFYLPEHYTDPFGNNTVLQYDDRDLFIQSSADSLNNVVSITGFNYRVMAPLEMMDINGNFTEVVYDILGLPAAVAIKGKGNEADNLEGVETDLDYAALLRFFTGPYDEELARRFLGNATARHVYYLGEGDVGSTYGNHPTCAAGIVREKHLAQLGTGEISPIQASFEYSDGMGQVIVKKVQAEPEEEDGPLRWIANGKTIFNNKGKPVKQYEPYFSESGHTFEEPPEVGVTPVFYYDAVGRQIRTELPDGAYTRIEFSPWYQAAYDANDTVLEEGNSWYAENTSGEEATVQTQRAARLATVHANTPALSFLDSLGREVITIAHNRVEDTAGPLEFNGKHYRDEKYITFLKLDAEGKPLWIKDARGNLVMQYVKREPLDPPQSIDNVEPDAYIPAYDIAGNLLFQHSMDGGDRWTLMDAAGQSLYAWDFNDRINESGEHVLENRTFQTHYDVLRRPLNQQLSINNRDWQVIESFVYGEGEIDDQARNLRGQVYRHDDPSGRLTNESLDFKGNLLEIRRQLVNDHREPIIDWSGGLPEGGLAPEIFTQRTEYDALNRMTRLYNWHHDAARVAVYEPVYNRRGILKSEELMVAADTTRIDTEHNRPYVAETRTPAIVHIAYNAKGQRTRIQYGNHTSTRYHYDPMTFRLVQLRTTRTSPGDSLPKTPGNLSDPNVFQNLYYTYDASGNISEIQDDAYEPVFFNNQRVEPRSFYSYDALYRLIEASGRENVMANAAPAPKEPDSLPSSFPRTDQALRNYTQIYTYDSIGNIIQMRHWAGLGPMEERWTRNYAYAQNNNRLLRTWTGSDELSAAHYDYDIHGSMFNLGNMPDEYFNNWDYRDMIHNLNLGGGGWAFYRYDSGKQRTRKRIERIGGVVEERLYLGGMELYRRFGAGAELLEEIETHHLFTGDERVLLVEDVRSTNHPNLLAGVLYRYQYSNHLGSVSLELDAGASVISYEEYHPYGTSAYRANNAEVTVTAKRYNYTGMERDEESGLSYHTARYYMPWLGRWGSVDPIGPAGGLNLYSYSFNNYVSSCDRSGEEPEITVYHRTSSRTAEAWEAGSGSPRSDLSRPHAWGGRGLYTQDSPTIPRRTARGDTIVELRIRESEIVEAPQDFGELFNEREGSTGDHVRRALGGERRVRGGEGEWEHGIRPERGRTRSTMVDEAIEGSSRLRHAAVIRVRLSDGRTFYIIRDTGRALIGSPRIAGRIDAATDRFVPRSSGIGAARAPGVRTTRSTIRPGRTGAPRVGSRGRSGGGRGGNLVIALVQSVSSETEDLISAGVYHDPEARLRQADVLHTSGTTREAARQARYQRDLQDLITVTAHDRGVSEDVVRAEFDRPASHSHIATIRPERSDVLFYDEIRARAEEIRSSGILGFLRSLF